MRYQASSSVIPLTRRSASIAGPRVTHEEWVASTSLRRPRSVAPPARPLQCLSLGAQLQLGGPGIHGPGDFRHAPSPSNGRHRLADFFIFMRPASPRPARRRPHEHSLGRVLGDMPSRPSVEAMSTSGIVAPVSSREFFRGARVPHHLPPTDGPPESIVKAPLPRSSSASR